MQLHQLLRQLMDNVPVVIFDMANHCLLKAQTKADIPISYYEEEIFKISCGFLDQNYKIAGLHIMLVK